MKRIVLSVFVLALISLASCKKTYTCECDYILTVSNGGVVDGGTTTTKTYKNEAAALEDCQAQEDEINAPENQSGECVATPG